MFYYLVPNQPFTYTSFPPIQLHSPKKKMPRHLPHLNIHTSRSWVLQYQIHHLNLTISCVTLTSIKSFLHAMRVINTSHTRILKRRPDKKMNKNNLTKNVQYKRTGHTDRDHRYVLHPPHVHPEKLVTLASSLLVTLYAPCTSTFIAYRTGLD